jgi:hypothetical protein
MKHVYNDGGRAKAGYVGRTGDCVARAIAIATEQPYQVVYDALAHGNVTQRRSKHTRKSHRAKTAARGITVQRKWFKEYMQSLGWVWTPTMGIGTGCTVHLVANELPAGRLVVSLSRHYTAVVDKVIHDTYDCSSRGVTVYPPSTPLNELPKLARKLSNNGGWVYEPQRCVYGYWSKGECK